MPQLFRLATMTSWGNVLKSMGVCAPSAVIILSQPQADHGDGSFQTLYYLAASALEITSSWAQQNEQGTAWIMVNGARHGMTVNATQQH